MARFEIVEQEGMRFVKIGLENETVRAESGALSTMSGDIVMDVPMPSVGRLLKSYLSEEAYLRPTYTGTATSCSSRPTMASTSSTCRGGPGSWPVEFTGRPRRRWR
ncbi:MAG TPA: AIM24 family protein [Hyphomicrobiaceae bacterium]|jgi:uncharacterized protein (AIM24 family)|nr:AIM24 family protein [Hyphomicrobiaceae bacterium]